MSPLLSVHGLAVGFHRRGAAAGAVDGVSFELEAGETIAIVGPPGSGKTVVALALLGILPRCARVTDGAVTLDGVNLLELSQTRLREIRGRDLALVFQDARSSLNPVLRVGRQITETLQKHLGVGKDRARSQAIRLLERVGVPDAAERVDDYPHQLSDDTCRRVMIAMAIACRPKVLMVDEPPASSDPEQGTPILDLLRGVAAEQGMSMILLSRDVEGVSRISDRTYNMVAGAFVENHHADDPDATGASSGRATMRRKERGDGHEDERRP